MFFLLKTEKKFPSSIEKPSKKPTAKRITGEPNTNLALSPLMVRKELPPSLKKPLAKHFPREDSKDVRFFAFGWTPATIPKGICTKNESFGKAQDYSPESLCYQSEHFRQLYHSFFVSSRVGHFYQKPKLK